MKPQNLKQPMPAQDQSAVENRLTEADELDFEDDAPTPGFGEEQSTGIDATARKAGLTEASQPGEGPTQDDLTRETLIIEDGARSQKEREQGNLEPDDKRLSIVNSDEIGAGGGLDEAELAQLDASDKKSLAPIGKRRSDDKK